MSHFIELEVPHLDPIPGLWYVRARNNHHDRIYLIKHGDLEHEDFIDPRDLNKIYFDTELQAFEAIDKYYKRYGMKNPYLSQWEDAKNLEVADETLKEVIESQVMEFE